MTQKIQKIKQTNKQKNSSDKSLVDSKTRGIMTTTKKKRIREKKKKKKG